MTVSTPRVLFAAPGSGSGKTTVVSAVLSALRQKGLRCAAFKCGPDFIDPMFHQAVLGVPSDNLDLFLMGASACRAVFADRAQQAQLAIVEGVMGYYDGMGTTDRYSSYHLARELDLPVILVVECRGVGATLAAVLNGIAHERPDSRVRGVLFNRMRPAMYAYYRTIVEERTGLQAFGYLPDLPECRLESRHLGLVTAGEVRNLRAKTDRLAEAAGQSVDLEGICKLAGEARPFDAVEMPRLGKKTVKIAVARDAAFCFYYEASLSALARMGAELVLFSPLTDTCVPDGDGLLLGGGYPELYAAQLAQNRSMRDSIRQAVQSGMPCVAECGGFLYLQQTLRDTDEQVWPMAGVLPGEGHMTGRLQRFGYVELTAKHDSLLCAAGETVRGHEFHYSDSTACGDAFTARRPSNGRSYPCVAAGASLYAGYPHLHFAGAPVQTERFLNACMRWKRMHKGGTARLREGGTP